MAQQIIAIQQTTIQQTTIQQTTFQQTTIIAIDASATRNAYAVPPRQNAPRIYAVRNTANYCPAGLQPVTINGVICCGTPNQSVSYQSMKAHPAIRKARAQRSLGQNSRVICPADEKGCYSE